MRVRWEVATAMAGLAGLALVAAFAASGARSAGPFGPPDETTCTFDPERGLVRVEYGIPGHGREQAPTVWISQAGGVIRIEEDLPGPGPNVQCAGGTPTVRNTDRVQLDAATRLRASETYLRVGANGFTPGATPEPGGDEIEIVSSLRSTARIHLGGGRGADQWAVGSAYGDRYLVNFNTRKQEPDADFIIEPAPRSLSANLSSGANHVTARRGAGTGLPLSIDLDLIGDSGNDHFVGGPGADDLLGYEGNDVLDGGRGEDRLDIVGGKGHDRLICGPGRDEYRSSGKDRIRCSAADIGRGSAARRP